MPDTIVKSNILKGGEFLIKDTEYQDIYIREDMDEEQAMIYQTVRDFVKTEVEPNVHKIEKQEDGIAVDLMKKLAELGFLGTHMPEQYGGLQMDTNTNTYIAEAFGDSGSISVAFAAHTGIGMLPILYFGNDSQKEKYLPGLINGELQAAYCLTEPGSGSDALAAKTKAELSEDGTHYILNGQKMWITNAGFAGLFIVFAQVDGDKFTGFIVEKGSEGLTLGAEEDKLGIKGSSTRQVFFENVKVPVENVLGEIGKGHLIAFNVLNIGRYKLGALCLGAAKGNHAKAINYANERNQFKQPISNFGAIKYKIAQQAIRLFTTESSLYQVSNQLSSKKAALEEDGFEFGQAKLQAAEEYAIECAILKVAGSEALDYVVDETVQIHGGMGYSEEGFAARGYRDSRINRIFEGTNEINRLLSIDMLLKRAMKGELDIIGPAWEVQKELASMPGFGNPQGEYAAEYKAVKEFKKLILMVAGGAAKMQMDGKLNLKHEQEIIMNVADMLIQLHLAESTLLRVHKLSQAPEKRKVDQEVYDAILKVFLTDTTAAMNKFATDALVSFAEGDLLRTFLMGVKRFTKYQPTNVKKGRRLIADTLIQANDYVL
ncbi:MAG: acyl-CoA dehydrogenase family protein [Bacteroidota bacterium]